MGGGRGVGGQDVGGVQLVDGDDVHVRRVAQREPGDVVTALEHDQEATTRREPGQRGEGRLGGRCLTGDQRVDHVDAVVAGPVGQRALEGGSLPLLGGALVVVTRLRAVAFGRAWCREGGCQYG